MSLKKFVRTLKEHSWNVVGIISSVALLFFGIWQLDLIMVGPVWGEGWCHPVGRYADDYFECWLWKTTVGEAYNVLLFLIFVAFWLLFLSVWTWEERKS